MHLVDVDGPYLHKKSKICKVGHGSPIAPSNCPLNWLKAILSTCWHGEEHPSCHNWHCQCIFLFMGTSVRIVVMEHWELLRRGSTQWPSGCIERLEVNAQHTQHCHIHQSWSPPWGQERNYHVWALLRQARPFAAHRGKHEYMWVLKHPVTYTEYGTTTGCLYSGSIQSHGNHCAFCWLGSGHLVKMRGCQQHLLIFTATYWHFTSKEESTGHRWPSISLSLWTVCGEEDLLAAQVQLFQLEHEWVTGSELWCCVLLHLLICSNTRNPIPASPKRASTPNGTATSQHPREVTQVCINVSTKTTWDIRRYALFSFQQTIDCNMQNKAGSSYVITQVVYTPHHRQFSQGHLRKNSYRMQASRSNWFYPGPWPTWAVNLFQSALYSQRALHQLHCSWVQCPARMRGLCGFHVCRSCLYMDICSEVAMWENYFEYLLHLS